MSPMLTSTGCNNSFAKLCWAVFYYRNMLSWLWAWPKHFGGPAQALIGASELPKTPFRNCALLLPVPFVFGQEQPEPGKGAGSSSNQKPAASSQAAHGMWLCNMGNTPSCSCPGSSGRARSGQQIWGDPGGEHSWHPWAWGNRGAQRTGLAPGKVMCFPCSVWSLADSVHATVGSSEQSTYTHLLHKASTKLTVKTNQLSH